MGKFIIKLQHRGQLKQWSIEAINVAHIANGLGMPDMLAAQYIYNERYQKTSLDAAVNLPSDTSWMNEAPHE